MKGELHSGVSSSSLLPERSETNFGKGHVDCEPTRRRFSLLGEGETGSPRRRFRARERALDAAVGGRGGVCDEVEGSPRPRRGKGS